MECNQGIVYGGDLYEELAEIEKVSEKSEDGTLAQGTHTAGCTGFWTIYCC